jgi:hypothetical protein
MEEEPNMTDPTHIIWLDYYNKYMDIIEKEKEGFRFPECGCRAGYECKFVYVKIRDVTILHRGSRPLNNFDPYLLDMLLQRTRD